MGFNIDINQAFQQAFGFGIPDNPFIAKKQAFDKIVRKDYSVPPKGSVKPGETTNPFLIPNGEDKPTHSSTGAPYYDTDLLGREFFMPVYLSHADKNGNTISYTDKNDPNVWQLPFPVISIRGNISIVDTNLVQRRGSVHEIINQDDYLISIKGIMVTEDNTFPEAMVRRLREFYEIGQSLTIISALTDQFLHNGEDKVIIRAFDMPGVPGSQGLRAYSLDLVSDSIFTLELV